jgi:hypothetical protein
VIVVLKRNARNVVDFRSGAWGLLVVVVVVGGGIFHDTIGHPVRVGSPNFGARGFAP